MKRVLKITALLLVAINTYELAAQSVPEPRFEVATVKLAAHGANGYGTIFNSHGVRLENVTVKEALIFAWKLHPFQIVGGTPWLDTERFDIVGKADHKPVTGEVESMMRNLLIERFHLGVRTEMRELPTYALVLARSDRKPGAGLTESPEGTCRNPENPGPPPRVSCTGFVLGRTVIKGLDVYLSTLTVTLGRLLGRVVVDETGLKGKFNIYAEWVLDDFSPDVTVPGIADTTGPMMAAIRDQLGLKLQAQKSPVRILIIDSAAKPDAN